MAARQPSNELVADILSRAADPEIRQAGLRDAAKLLRAVIGIDVPLDDLSGAATTAFRRRSARLKKLHPRCQSINVFPQRRQVLMSSLDIPSQRIQGAADLVNVPRQGIEHTFVHRENAA